MRPPDGSRAPCNESELLRKVQPSPKKEAKWHGLNLSKLNEVPGVLAMPDFLTKTWLHYRLHWPGISVDEQSSQHNQQRH
jgi:hypothetical protein